MTNKREPMLAERKSEHGWAEAALESVRLCWDRLHALVTSRAR
jgi:hypothetical protein